MGIIYMGTHIKTGNVYIGKTERSLQQRINEHNKQNNTYISKAIQKYGKDSFAWVIIDETNNKEDLNNLEKEYIAYYKMIGKHLYNLTEGGEGCLGYKHTANVKNIISQKQLGNKKSLGHKHTKESLDKMHKGKINKTYYMLSPKNELVVIENMSLFCRDRNLITTLMCKVARGLRYQHKGWKKYKK